MGGSSRGDMNATYERYSGNGGTAGEYERRRRELLAGSNSREGIDMQDR